MGHTKETCWKLHGKPADWKPKAEREAYAQAAATDQAQQFGQITKEQLEILQQMGLNTLLRRHLQVPLKLTIACLLAKVLDPLLSLLKVILTNTGFWILVLLNT